MSVYIIFAAAIFLNALANILIKVGMVKISAPKNGIELVLKAITSPAIIFGILSFIGALIFYSQVLSKLNLSVAYPIMTIMGFLIVISVSAVILKESISALQVVGFAIMLLGVWLVARK